MTGLLGSPVRNLALGLAYTLSVIAAGTAAYSAAGWSPGDAVYMVVLTVFTVGYDEVRPVDTNVLRGITMAVIVFGCTGIIFLTGALVQFITVNQLKQILGERRMHTQIHDLAEHVIVCGFGRIGQMLVRELRAGGVTAVVLERDEHRAAEARDLGHLVLVGDATDETTLEEAGVTRARALATVLPNDAANVFITLSARSLNQGLRIIARGEAPSTERKLRHAGANMVVLPAHIGAERIAEIILFPDATRLMRGSDRMADFERELRTFGLELEVLPVAEDSEFVGATVQEVERRAKGAFFVVALNRRDGVTLPRPEPEVRVDAGDGLVLVGRGGQVRAMARAFDPAGS